MKYFYLLTILVSLVLFSCEILNEPQVNKKYGSLSGYVQLTDKNQNDQPKHFDGVKVEIIELKKSVITDSIGNWKFDSLEIGSYTISFNKTNYGTFKEFNKNVIENKINDIGKTELISIPKFKIDSLTYIVKPGNIMNFSSIINNYNNSNDGYHTYYYLFIFSKDSLLNFDNNRYSFMISEMEYSSIFPKSDFDFKISKLYVNGFKSKDTVYIKVYLHFYQEYYDPNTKETIFTTVNPNSSPRLMYILP